MNDISFSRAAGAYQDALRVAQNIIEKTAGDGTNEAKATGGVRFVDLLGSALQGAADSGFKSEAVATRALSGKADLTDVVTAVADAESALNTVVAIRDRVINAYQDIIKMPI